MILARRKAQPREVRRTLLIVGEGLAEETFLRHLKRVYAERGLKTITIKNAKGKGGGHVLDYSAGQRKAADYDQIAALLDTDADWNDERRALAQRRRILVFEATPCLEALLLDIAGLKAPAATAACKRAFMQHFGQEAHSQRVYTQHLPRETLEAARRRIELLDRLIHLLST
jgi:hypothetical protein